MKKHMKKLIALFLCLCVFNSGIQVYAGDISATTETAVDSSIAPVSEEPETVAQTILLTGKMSAVKTAQLQWTTDDTAATYKLCRATSKSGTYSVITTITGKSEEITYSDTNLALDSTYYYQVEKYMDNVLTDTSAITSVAIRTTAPASLTSSITSSNTVKLTWNTVSEASGYYIYRCATEKGMYKKIASSSTNSYTDTTTESANIYYYKVYSHSSTGKLYQVCASKAVSAFTKPDAPVITLKYSSAKVTVSWKAVPRAQTYYIYRKVSGGSYESIGKTTSLSYVDSSAAQNKTYTYKVCASYEPNNTTLKGPYSNEANIYTYYIDPNKKMIALTFDDGPGPYTQAIVNCLKQNNAHATFFVVGNRVNTYKSALKSASDNGNEIANHTYSHPILTSLSTANVKSQISKTDAAVKAVTGKTPSLIRAPGGGTNTRVRNAINKPFIYWSIDTLDWKYRNANRTVNVVMNNVKDGDIILMHDIHKTSKDAALILIPKLIKAGYQLVTVSELAQYRGYKMQNHVSYSSFRKK